MTPVETFNKLIALSIIFGVINALMDDVIIDFDIPGNLPVTIYNKRMRKDIESVCRAIPLAMFVMSMKNVMDF